MSVINFIINHPLNRGQRIKSLFRYFKWHVGCRLIPGRVLFEWINGSKIIVDRKESGLVGNVFGGLYEFSEMGYLLHVLKKDDIFFDIGANVGAYTILASAAIGAKTYCFEPVPSTYERLLVNIHVNNLAHKVKSFNVGISDKEGVLRFTSDQNCTNHIIFDDEIYENSVNVEVRTLDSFVDDKVPAVIKIDVEGFETLVLRGAKQTLQKEKLHSVIMELNGSGEQYGFDENDIINMIMYYGFKPYIYNPLTKQFKVSEGKNKESNNTIFVRNIDFIKRRIMDAPPVTINNKMF